MRQGIKYTACNVQGRVGGKEKKEEVFDKHRILIIMMWHTINGNKLIIANTETDCTQASPSDRI
jgi:hypothetical protein